MPSERRFDRAGGALLHPIALFAVALLLLNDHVLKAAYPGFVTGKLSDVAGLVFFPLFLVSVDEAIRARLGAFTGPDRRRLILAVTLTAVVFTLVQVWPLATDAYRYGLGAIQWPFRSIASLLAAGSLAPYRPVIVMADVTDLVTVPATLAALAVGWSRGRKTRFRTPRQG